MTLLVIKTRGLESAHDLLDGMGDRLEEPDALEQLIPGVLEIQEEWWNSLGGGSWGGHDLEVTGRLRAATTQLGADGQRLDVGGDELVFGLGAGGPGDPAHYGAILASRDLSAIADPTDADAETLAEDYVEALLDG